MAQQSGRTARPLHDRVPQSDVLLQLEHLATYPAVRRGVTNGTLSLAGWWFDIATDDVHVYDPLTRSFGTLDRESIDKFTC
jgi:carbonic anhydrase